MFIPSLFNYFDPLNPPGQFDMLFEYRKLASKYNVSEVVIKNRIESLKYEIYQVAWGTSIHNIRILSKAQLEHEGISIKSCNELSKGKMNANPFTTKRQCS